MAGYFQPPLPPDNIVQNATETKAVMEHNGSTISSGNRRSFPDKARRRAPAGQRRHQIQLVCRSCQSKQRAAAYALYSQAQIDDFDEASGKQRLRWDVLRSDASSINDGGLFTYELEEKKQNIGGDFTIPFKAGGLAQKIKTVLGHLPQGHLRAGHIDPTTADRAPRGTQVTADSIGFGKADYEIYRRISGPACCITNRCLPPA